MHLSTTDNVTHDEKEELLTGLRAYNGQFLDLSNFSGDIGVYVRDDKGVMLGGLIGVRKGDWLGRVASRRCAFLRTAPAPGLAAW